jgi:hypothetical protein
VADELQAPLLQGKAVSLCWNSYMAEFCSHRCLMMHPSHTTALSVPSHTVHTHMEFLVPSHRTGTGNSFTQSTQARYTWPFH